MFSSTAVVFVQPGRVVRVLFVLLSDWEAADWGKEELDFSCVCSQVLGSELCLSGGEAEGFMMVLQVFVSLVISQMQIVRFLNWPKFAWNK